MTIAVGERVPQGTLQVMGTAGPEPKATDELFAGRTVAVFALPGAFTPTCSAQHLPGFITNADAFASKGVDEIVCLSVNDVFVMDAWGKDQSAAGKVTMAADGDGSFAKALGLEFDSGAFGGLRSQRYSMLVKDGAVTALNVEEGGGFGASSAETLLGQL